MLLYVLVVMVLGQSDTYLQHTSVYISMKACEDAKTIQVADAQRVRDSKFWRIKGDCSVSGELHDK